jgi:hypothetical protein
VVDDLRQMMPIPFGGERGVPGIVRYRRIHN